jgi:cell division protein FtsL
VFASLLVSAMVLGLTALNAVLAQGSFRIADLNKRVDALQQAYERKQLEVAELTSPARIAARAAALGMVLPEPKQVKVVHVPRPASRHGEGGGRHPARPGKSG